MVGTYGCTSYVDPCNAGQMHGGYPTTPMKISEIRTLIGTSGQLDLQNQTVRNLLGYSVTNTQINMQSAYNKIYWVACPSNCSCVSVCTCDCDYVSCCFPAGTAITMADGSIKHVEDVMVGDEVISFNEETQEQVICMVNKLKSPMRDHICLITFVNHVDLKITSDHPILTTKGWKSVDPESTHKGKAYKNLNCEKLQPGDDCITLAGTFAKIVDIVYEQGNVQTFTLDTVAPFPTFYANEILAHNCCCFPASSKVLMADYTWKNIEEVEIGEFVLSLDGKPNQVYDIEYPLLGNRALLAFEDNSLITSADHALWGRKDGEEWFVTRDTVELAYEALVGKGADLEKPIFNNDALEPFEYAHIDAL